MNLVILTGHVGKDPEVRHLDSGKAVANLSIATRAGKDKTDWHNVVMWDKSAEIVEKYVKKGSLISVKGSLKTRSWEKDGITKYVTEVVCYEVELLGRPSPNTNSVNESIPEPDDLPF